MAIWMNHWPVLYVSHIIMKKISENSECSLCVHATKRVSVIKKDLNQDIRPYHDIIWMNLCQRTGTTPQDHGQIGYR